MINRRHFLKQSAITSLGFLLLSKCTTAPDSGNKNRTGLHLVSDPNGYMDLPPGFSYKIISKTGRKMSDGFWVPGRPDGMGAFLNQAGKTVIVRNHENSPGSFEDGPFGKENELFANIDPTLLFDAGFKTRPSLGGTTTLIYNERTQSVEDEFMSLAGTTRNCAGGITPWGSWLTCEEDTTKADGEKVEKDHGFVFEVPALAKGLQKATPITEMGRFNHEAVAVDPNTGIVYQTEDRGDGLIYRYIPNVVGKLHEGGKLQVLAIIDQPKLDTRNWDAQTIKVGQQLKVQWLDIDNILAPEDDLRLRGFEKGAARFARGEGIWFGDRELFFACTNGGPAETGQVFRYQPSLAEGQAGEADNPGILELYAESPDKTVLHACDNLTIAPWGDVILCEDNGEINFIRGIDKNGQIYDFACNRSSSSEFAGLVFSPSGKTLFVNIQENGETLAITGPWDKFA